MAMYPCLSLPSLSFPTVTGAVCSFNSQYAGLPLKSHTVAVTATQSGSGTPSPDNVRPISGWSAITITANSVPTVISLGSTIYGGNYDAVSGVLTVTHGFVDLGSLTWYYNSGSKIFYSQSLQGELKSIAGSAVYNALSSDYEVISVNNLYNNEPDYSCAIGFIYSDRNINIKDSRYTDPTAFKTAMNGVMLAYELATPQTIQLPPVRVETQLTNNIFADTGDTTLQYIKLG